MRRVVIIIAHLLCDSKLLQATKSSGVPQSKSKVTSP